MKLYEYPFIPPIRRSYTQTNWKLRYLGLLISFVKTAPIDLELQVLCRIARFV